MGAARLISCSPWLRRCAFNTGDAGELGEFKRPRVRLELHPAELPIHEDEIWPLASGQCDRLTAVLGLTGSLLIVHNKNFLFHWPSHKVYGMSPAVDYPASIASNRDDHFSERRRSQ